MPPSVATGARLRACTPCSAPCAWCEPPAMRVVRPLFRCVPPDGPLGTARRRSRAVCRLRARRVRWTRSRRAWTKKPPRGCAAGPRCVPGCRQLGSRNGSPAASPPRARAAPDSRRRAAQGAAASPSVALPPAVRADTASARRCGAASMRLAVCTRRVGTPPLTPPGAPAGLRRRRRSQRHRAAVVAHAVQGTTRQRWPRHRRRACRCSSRVEMPARASCFHLR